MIFPALGMMSAAWLLIVSFLGLETGFRADLALAAGLIAFPLALASVWSFRAGIVMTAIGVMVAIANLLLPTSGGLASLAVAAAAMAVAGMAPQPVVETTPIEQEDASKEMSRTPPPHTTQDPHPVPA
jgi:hypothetical protein